MAPTLGRVYAITYILWREDLLDVERQGGGVDILIATKSEHSLLTSGISCELAGYAFSGSSFEGDHLHAVGRAPARSSVATTMSRE